MKLDDFKFKTIDNLKTYLTLTTESLSNYNNNTYLANVMTPLSYNGEEYHFDSNSEFYIYGDRVLIVDSDRSFETYDNETSYIVYKDTKLIVNFSGELYKLTSTYQNVIKELDSIDQPYPKGFMLNDNRLLRAVENPSYVNKQYKMVGTILASGSEHLREIFKSYSVCLTTDISLSIDKNHNLNELEDIKNQLIVISQCKKQLVFIPIMLSFNKMTYRLSLILNSITGIGILFDPRYYVGNELKDYYIDIVKYIKRKLVRYYPELNIKSINQLDIPFIYPFQPNMDDFYCVSWGYYLLVLFALNTEMPFEDVINFLYNIGESGLRVAVQRFLFWMF